MAYPRSFHRIVVLGDLYGTERFNFGLSVAPLTGGPNIPPATAALATDVGAAVASWWPKALGAGGAGIIQPARVISVKVNRINSAGKYEDPVSQEAVIGPIQGGNGTLVPAQLALTVTLASVIPRGAGSKNRFYLPPIGAFSPLASDGRLSVANAQTLATAAKSLIDSINAVYSGFGGGFDVSHRVAVASNVGAGSFRDVVQARVGRVPDTIRSRRSSLVEDYQVATIA